MCPVHCQHALAVQPSLQDCELAVAAEISLQDPVRQSVAALGVAAAEMHQTAVLKGGYE